MPSEGLCLRLTHTGLAKGSLPLSDVMDGVDALGSFRKPGPVSIPFNATVELVYSSTVAISFEQGAIRSFIDQGLLTASFVIGSTLGMYLGGSLPPLAGVEGAVLAEGPVGTLTFRQLTESEILPDWAITGFSASTGLVEVGSTATNPSFTASYVDVARVDTATLTDSEATPAKNVTGTPSAFSSGGSFTKTTLNDTVTFTVTATDTLTGASDARNSVVTWAPRVFWGADVDGLSSEADIEGLSNSALDTNRNRTFSVSPGAGEHIYYAYPDSYGAATFTVGGFTGGFSLVSSAISVTNPFGVTTNYRLYKSVAAGLGATTVSVS